MTSINIKMHAETIKEAAKAYGADLSADYNAVVEQVKAGELDKAVWLAEDLSFAFNQAFDNAVENKTSNEKIIRSAGVKFAQNWIREAYSKTSNPFD